MPNLIHGDLTGLKYGRWTVLSRAGSGRWWCLCECGEKHRVSSTSLVKGESKGCKPCGIGLPNGWASFNAVYDTYLRNANRCGRPFELTKEEARLLFDGDCKYCGDKPSLERKPRNRIKTGYTYNGIDRVDNAVGYVFSNCVSCCKLCNHMKHILSLEEFISHIKKIASRVAEV